jgi:hypothetical protein
MISASAATAPTNYFKYASIAVQHTQWARRQASVPRSGYAQVGEGALRRVTFPDSS